MTDVRKVLLGLLVQAALIAFGLYLAFAQDAFPGASVLGRAALAALFVGVAILLGEIAKLRMQFHALLGAIQGGLSASIPRDDRMAIDVLVAALDSRDSGVREKAHRNLVRLTKQDLPPDAARWKAWWAQARAGFRTEGGSR